MIKAIFFDIDGTLIPFNNKQLPESTKLALDSLKEKGIKIFIATGRPKNLMGFIQELYPFDGYLTFNGQYCFDEKDNTIYESTISTDNWDSFIHYIEQEKIGVVFCTKNHNYNNIYVTRPDFLKNETMEDMDSIKDMELMQMNAFIPEHKDDEFVKYLHGIKSARWSPDFADIIPIHGGKNIGIDQMIEYYGIKLEETMAFGDGGNDIDMLKHCSIGVAMGNANDKVKAHADYVTTNVDDHGIYNALKHFNII